MSELKVLERLIRGMPGDGAWQERLERFYAPQAAHYDSFRERMLHGRERLLDLLEIEPGCKLLEIGGGTGRNLELLGARLHACARVELVDLCRPLLAIAEERARRLSWRNVILTHADAVSIAPTEDKPDRIFFSYSLSMIPEWERALDNACAILKPGGKLGVVDFHLPASGMSRAASSFWRNWFRHSQVHLRRELLSALTERLAPQAIHQERGSLPYLPGLHAPYLIFVGQKAE